MKDPRLGLFWLPETIGGKSLPGHFEELLDLPVCEFLTEFRLRFRVEVSFFLISTCFGLQLDMPVIQRVEHLAEDVEKLIITSFRGDSGSVGVILIFPVDIPQRKKWVPVVKGLPQILKIFFRVASDLLCPPFCMCEDVRYGNVNHSFVTVKLINPCGVLIWQPFCQRYSSHFNLFATLTAGQSDRAPAELGQQGSNLGLPSPINEHCGIIASA